MVRLRCEYYRVPHSEWLRGIRHLNLAQVYLRTLCSLCKIETFYPVKYFTTLRCNGKDLRVLFYLDMSSVVGFAYPRLAALDANKHF